MQVDCNALPQSTVVDGLAWIDRDPLCDSLLRDVLVVRWLLPLHAPPHPACQPRHDPRGSGDGRSCVMPSEVSPQHQHQQPPTNSYPPPPAPHEHWQHQAAPPPGQPAYDNYIRTTPIVPATVETRNAPPPPAPEPERGSKDTIINEVRA